MPFQIFAESDYNKLASYYGLQTFSLEDDEYVAAANSQRFVEIQNKSLKRGHEIAIGGKHFKPKYSRCKEGMTEMGSINAVYNVVILPDKDVYSNENLSMARTIFAANYNGVGKKELKCIETKAVKSIISCLNPFHIWNTVCE